MMTPEIREIVSSKTRFTYKYDDKLFYGLKELKDYLSSKFPDIEISTVSLGRKIRGLDIIKLRKSVIFIDDRGQSNSSVVVYNDKPDDISDDGNITVNKS